LVSGFVPQPDLPLLPLLIPTTFTDNSAIVPNSIAEQSVIQVSSFQSQGFTEVSIPKISSFQTGLKHSATGQVGSAQIDIPQISTTQISINKIDVGEAGITQVTLPQINTSQVGTFQLYSTQINATEISFSNSIAAEQLFSRHNTSPTSLYNLNNTALTLWNSYLQTMTPLNLNIEIADLPTGQLAEANITGFDSTGRPNAGTLYLDTDANGLGWF
jgi:hypothetical protein